MIADSNSLLGFLTNGLIGMVGGNTLFLGIVVFLIVTILLILARAKASTSIMIGMSLAFVFSAVTDTAGSFMWLFWLAIIVALFLFVTGIFNKLKGQ